MFINQRFLLSFFLVTLAMQIWGVPQLILASDDEIADRMENLGAQVVRQGEHVVELAFRDSRQLGPSEWKQIGQLAKLKKLTTYGGASGLNDETVGELTHLQELESLSTDGSQLSDEGLAKLGQIKSLRNVAFFHLSFRKEGFTGQGFAAWKDLPNLERLTVAGMSLGDAGFIEIGKLQTLREFRTWHTYRTEASNAEIARLSNLKTLKLGQRLPRGKGTPLSLSDESIASILKIKSLESLDIGEAPFSIAALGQLKSLPNLKVLKINTTELTEQDIAELKSLLPGIKVDFTPITPEQLTKLKTYLE